MRRSEKEIKDKAAIIDVLHRCHIGRLGTIGKDGYPIVKPLNFAYYKATLNPPSSPFPDKTIRGQVFKGGKEEDFSKGGLVGFTGGKIYFHTAKQGEKIEDIKRDCRVCFEVDLPIAYVKAKNNPCEADYLYRSVIIKGRAKIIEDRDEKLFGLKCLMEKHQPIGGYGEYTEEKLNKVGIVRINIEEMTGKEDLGDTAKMKEMVLKVLREKSPLPITIERE